MTKAATTKAAKPATQGKATRKRAPKKSAWDKQSDKVKRLTLAVKAAQDKLRIATAELKAMPVGK